MSERGDQLREMFRSLSEESAVRAVILHNSDMITNEFRLKVLREEIRNIEEHIAAEGRGPSAAARRQLRRSKELRKKVQEANPAEPR